MSYFVRADPAQSPRREGIAHGRKEIPPLPSHLHADDIKEQKIAEYQKNATEFIFKLDSARPHPQGKATGNSNFKHLKESKVFQEPRLDTPPKARIRLGVSDEELRKIWAEDDAKERAAKAMMEHTDLVGKMHKDNYPMARKKEASHPHKVPAKLSKPDENNSEPQGFKGMGEYSKPQQRQGVLVKPQEGFLPPEFQKKERKMGRRCRFPPDTFTFMEPQQVFNGPEN